ncbi:GNAT family N-acetyltransferase [Brevibacterium sp. FME17]|uniref:GNAT family N-acetyltransferase n=1 Tax=Brevibacterium sp. FME17 TaxID=2742606 RepID=UPI0018674E92|nr:GNAT family N-acetyltransferase [Brevibacterium sp. FME17]
MNERQNQESAEVGRRSALKSRIRPLSAQTPDEVFLPFLDLCFNWSMDKPRIEVDELRERDDAAFYFKDWGRDGDIAVAAYAKAPNGRESSEDSAAGESAPEIVGLAWLRLAAFDAVIEKSNEATSTTAGTTGTTAEVGSRFTGYGWVAADIPELSMAVLPEHQSQGIGGMLLEVVCTLAKMSGFPAVSLSAEDGNGAARLYHDHGFVTVGRNGDADILVRQLK